MAPPGYGARVEGIPAVEAAVRAGRARVLQVEGRSASSPRMARLVGSAERSGVKVETVESLKGRAVTSSPQGVIAQCRPMAPVGLGDLICEADPAALLVVDHVTDPRNLGAIARSAVAAGIPRLVIPRRRGAPLSPSAFKAAAGALEHTRVCFVSSVPDVIRQLSRRQIWTVGLTGDSAHSLFDLQLLASPVALVVGAEHRGLSQLVSRRVDVLASIPMKPDADSLNASVAAGLALFELARVRGYFVKPKGE